MINRAVYTYCTNQGNNLLCGFYDEDSFVDTFKESLEKAHLYFDTVVVYADQEGVDFLTSKGINESFAVVDYSSYDYDRGYWNFPKLITYNLQSERFIHIDTDFILEEQPDNLDKEIVCEKLRGLVIPQRTLKFLPKSVLKYYNPSNICSGLLGGNPNIFKTLYNVASVLVKPKNQNLSFENLYGIEEILLGAICKKNNITPFGITTEYTHLQGPLPKRDLFLDKITEDQLNVQ